MRPPLSDVPEESAYQRMDERSDVLTKRLAKHLKRRFEAHSKALDRPSLALAMAYSDSGAARMAIDHRSTAMSWARAMVPKLPDAVKKAGRMPPIDSEEAAIIDGFVEAGIDAGLETLPESVRSRVDIEAATRLTRKRLVQGLFRQNLSALADAQNGLDLLVTSSRIPTVAMLLDIELLASSFGLTTAQAKALVREAVLDRASGVPITAIKREIRKRIKKMLEIRYETLAQTLGREAIATAQQALYETAIRQGLLDTEKVVKEWVTRHDEKVCERCDAFDGKRAEIDGMFVSDLREEAFQPGIHPRCRCAIRLVTLRSAARKPRRRAA